MISHTLNLLGKYALRQDNKPKSKIDTKVEGAVEKAFKERVLMNSRPADQGATSEKPDIEKLKKITTSAQHPLMSATAIFPFELFPSTIDIDRQKVTIAHRSFFRVASVFSLQIEDLQVVTVDVGPFFGSVHLASKFFVDNLQSINYLHRKDAVKIQRLLQGFIIAYKRKVDCSNVGREQLLTLLNDLGQGASS